MIRAETKNVDGDDERECEDKKATKVIKPGLVIIGILTDKGVLRVSY